MKRLLRFIATAVALLVIVLVFTSCESVNNGRYHYLADFNSGTSFEDYGFKHNRLDTDFRFGKGDKRLKFHAEFNEDRILYTVTDITDDRISEVKTFSEIYSIYHDSWDEYDRKILGGNGVTAEKDGGIDTLILYISGNKYTAWFSPYAPTPYIEIRVTEIA